MTMPLFNRKTKTITCNKQQILLYELHVRLQNGATLIAALEGIVTQQHKRIAARLQRILQNVKNGQMLSQALRTENLLYDEIINVIEAGENTHHLQQSILMSDDLLSQMEKRKESIRRALSYPLFLLIICVCSIAFATYLLLPQLQVIALYDQDLPFSTKFFLFFLALSLYQWLGLFTILTLFIGGIIRFRHCYFFAHLLLNMGLLGKIILYQDLSCFCHHMTVCMKIQLNVPKALQQSASLFKNRVLKHHSQDMVNAVLQGHSLSNALEQHPYLPDIISQTIRGVRGQANLSLCFLTLTTHFSELSKRYMEKMQPFIEPLLTLCIGIILAFFIHAIILPLYGGTM